MAIITMLLSRRKNKELAGKRIRRKFLFQKKAGKTDGDETETISSTSSISSDEAEPLYDVKGTSILSGRMLHDTTISIVTTKKTAEDAPVFDMTAMTGPNKGEETKFQCRTKHDMEPDIYGQIHPNETPDLIAEKLVAFDQAVLALPNKKNACLNQAMEKCPHLLDDAFKLLFLRCETFNEKKAAKRYPKYWDKRVEVFGHVKAFQPLTQEGALKDDEAALAIGFATLAGGMKDSAGRSIVYIDTANQDFKAYTSMSLVRAMWYTFHAALEENEETQKQGIIVVSDVSTMSIATIDQKATREAAASLTGCLPVRLSGIHCCLAPRLFRTLFPLIKMLLGERLGKRLNVHPGGIEGTQKGLAKYGIVKDNIPTELGGTIALDHEAWLAGRQ